MKVVVTTKHSGVFFGEIDEARVTDEVTLKNARLCVFWPSEVKGFLGLAAVGPLKGSRISPPVPTLHLSAVTSISECTNEAAKLWEEGPWS